MATVSEHENIRNVIAKFAFCVDDQDWDGFYEVFTDDAFINYTFMPDTGAQRGVTNIINLIRTAVADTVSQHGLTTQSISLTGTHDATAITYVTVLHVGTEKHRYPDETFYSWGKYVDKLVKGSFGGKEGWRISERIVIDHLPKRGNVLLLSKHD